MVSTTSRHFESSLPPSYVTNVADCLNMQGRRIDAMHVPDRCVILTKLQILNYNRSQVEREANYFATLSIVYG